MNAIRCGLVGILAALAAGGQTTQGLISGRIVDSQSGAAVAGAAITWLGTASGVGGGAATDAAGSYLLPLLSPGSYRVRASAPKYQPQEFYGIVLPVAGRVELDFRLRPLNDVWEAGQYRSVFLPGTKSIVTFYGPDVDTSRAAMFETPAGKTGALESSLSDVIDPAQVRDLPLAGRDVYTMLATQPGITADTTTTRGLGLSAGGQRPSSSNFLLDGVENNNCLVTGPLTAIAPEAVQEYRVSRNNFSAEYGRTAGYLANAVTRSGGAAWHGTGYFYAKNDALNANEFQQNVRGVPRLPSREIQPGFHVGGPLRRRRLFGAGSWERLRSRARLEPISYTVPTQALIAFTAASSKARHLLSSFPPPVTGERTLFTAPVSIAQPVSVDRSLGLARMDAVEGRHRLMGRVAIARLGRPDFIWSPYADFTSGLRQNAASVALGLESSFSPAWTNELRMARNDDDLGWDRAHPEIPALTAGAFEPVVLPGSPAFYAYRNRTQSWEVNDNMLWAHGRHLAKFGFGLLRRGISGHLTAGRDGMYQFADVLDFALDRPSVFVGTVSRSSPGAPQFERGWRQRQFSAFAQDTVRAGSRLVIDYGVRYENFGVPRTTGPVQDAEVRLGGGSTLPEKLAGARLVFPAGAGRTMYDARSGAWAVRAGFSYRMLRGSYGIFYDRPFDNLWQNLRNNNVMLGYAPNGQGSLLPAAFPNLTVIQPGFRNPYAQNWFLGARQQAGNWAFEVNGSGSLGRRLITTDLVNRALSVPHAADGIGRYNPNLDDLAYRANQGSASYAALSTIARYRSSRLQMQAAYTWSHAIDNQSDALAGDFFDLSFARITSGSGRNTMSAFSRQFDSRGDRGNSDFDQRHNLVFYSIYELPGLFRGWKVAQLAALRSGFPVTVGAPSTLEEGGEYLVNNRADVLNPARLTAEADVPGGRRLLDTAAFAEPAPGKRGNSGRNALYGPGLFNIDVSLSRTVRLPALGEAGRLTLRADAFNFLNHTNLDTPDSFVSSAGFGIALYGRHGRASGFPALSPFNETARQIQILVRMEF